MNSEELQKELEASLEAGSGPKIARFVLSCLGGIPVVGGAIGGVGSAWSEKEQERFNKIFITWLKLQEDEMKEIGSTLMEVMGRLDLTDATIQQRVESPEYMQIIKKAFRDWSAAESEEKRILIRNLLANSAATRICTDDVIRMFVQWIEIYSEAHFAVVREVFVNPGSTRQQIWDGIHGEEVRDDSAEADLFKLLIHDLTTGYVIRQHRESDQDGRFIVKQKQRGSGPKRVMASPFDDKKEYELTELGKQFVSYTMNEIVPKLGPSNP